jgi:hypothetical protein
MQATYQCEQEYDSFWHKQCLGQHMETNEQKTYKQTITAQLRLCLSCWCSGKASAEEMALCDIQAVLIM